MNQIITLLAMTQPQGQQGSGGLAGMMVPMVLIFVIFYFLLIRPQQKKAREHQAFLDKLEKGTEIITTGGLIGKITSLTNSIVTIEVAPKIKVKITRGSIAGVAPSGTTETNDKAS